MTLTDLLTGLVTNGSRVRLNDTGTGVRVRGGRASPDLLTRVTIHKNDLVLLLHEARSLAADLYRSGEIDAFATELDAARARGTLSLADWYASHHAISLAQRWKRAGSSTHTLTKQEAVHP